MQRLTALKRLRLARSRVSGLGLAALGPLQKLELLDLGGLRYIFDDDLARLKDLTALRELDLGRALLAGPGLEHLAGLRNLQRLVLPEEGLDEAAVKRLQRALPKAKIERVQNYDHTNHHSIYTPDQGDAVWDRFWVGDYPGFANLLSRWVASPRHNYEVTLWLGHAYWLQGDRRKAAATYHQALAEIEKELAALLDERDRRNNRTIPDQRDEMDDFKEGMDDFKLLTTYNDCWPLVHFINEFEKYELGDYDAALRTVSQARRLHAEMGGGYCPLTEALVVERLAAGEAQEKAGNLAAAMECYLRFQFLGSGDDHYDTFHNRPPELAERVSALRAKLVGQALPATSKFAILSETMRQAKFEPGKPEEKAPKRPGRQPRGPDADIFVVLAPPGKAFVSLAFNVVPSESFHGMAYDLGMSPDNSHGGWLSVTEKDLAQHAYEIPAESKDVVCFVFPRKDGRSGLSQLTVRVKEWRKEEPASAAKATPAAARKVEAVGPLESVPVELPGFAHLGLADAALAVLPDGRWLMALPAPGPSQRRQIMLATSRDGRRWDPPWSFEHNDMFDAMHPLLFIEGQETWMFYRSNRFCLAAMESGDRRGSVYLLWLTRSRDGHTWTRPVPVQGADFMYEPRNQWQDRDRSRLFRTRSAEYALLTGMRIVQDIAPGRLAQRGLLNCWRWPPETHVSETAEATAIFDPEGRCHLFACRNTGEVYYCQPDNFVDLPAPTMLFRVDNIAANNPQALFAGEIQTLLPLIDGNRLLLLYAVKESVFLRGGTIESGSAKLGPPLTLPGLSFKNIGRQFLRHNGLIYLPSGKNVPGPPPSDVEEVSRFARASKAAPRRDSGGDGPRLLQGDLDRVFKAVASP